MFDPDSTTILAIVIVSYLIAFFLAFGVGANDVANSFGTSVGSGVLTLRQACILATIFEILGSALLGYKVSETVRLGVFDVSMYKDQEQLLMLGYLSALIGGAIWNLVATFLRLPISGTHSIVGAVLGFTLVPKGFNGLRWLEILKVASSWIISPFLSGAVSVFLCFFIIKFITEKPQPLEPGLKSLPIFYGFTIMINLFSILHDGPKFLYLDKLPWWVALLVSISFAVSTGLVVWFFVVPFQRKTIAKSLANQSTKKEIISDNNHCNVDSINEINKNDMIAMESVSLKAINDLESGKTVVTKDNDIDADKHVDQQTKEAIKLNLNESNEITEKPEVSALFKYLQILTACFGAFAHGGNDVSNAIGPLIAIILIHNEGNVFQRGQSPYYLMLYGGIGISVGLIVWGRKVIKTLGSDLTTITPSTGFTIEIGSAATVLLASKIGIPISTTHCKVGSVVCVGAFRARALGLKHAKSSVDWKLFGNIATAWILTVPITALFSALSMFILTSLLPSPRVSSTPFY